MPTVEVTTGSPDRRMGNPADLVARDSAITTAEARLLLDRVSQRAASAAGLGFPPWRQTYTLGLRGSGTGFLPAYAKPIESVTTVADPDEIASPGLYIAFGDERVHPFMQDYLGFPSNWKDGRREYWQIGWIPKREGNGTRLMAQTSVLWESTRGLRFEILQLVVDDGSFFLFRDKVGFAFESEISQSGTPIFAR